MWAYDTCLEVAGIQVILKSRTGLRKLGTGYMPQKRERVNWERKVVSIVGKEGSEDND